MASLGNSSGPMGEGDMLSSAPSHPLVSSPSIWFWVERGWESSNLFGPGAFQDPLCSQILGHPPVHTTGTSLVN